MATKTHALRAIEQANTPAMNESASPWPIDLPNSTRRATDYVHTCTNPHAAARSGANTGRVPPETGTRHASVHSEKHESAYGARDYTHGHEPKPPTVTYYEEYLHRIGTPIARIFTE